ncbi:hypothetical protein CMI37_20300 [Candidatus Pacearchaeota archaeon]|nr:hypothetical protein [Candidatus Pacearchaeota archaeon]|tara:strand:- start:1562 stop:1756 length:195 start_codon:yes stop_codon:yes gene_type:complete
MANDEQVLEALGGLKNQVTETMNAVYELRRNGSKYKTAERAALVARVNGLELTVPRIVAGWDGS